MNTSSITERDKKLLYFLGLIVIAALFYIIGIRPLNNKISKLEDKIDTAQVEFDTTKMKIFQLGTLEEFEESAVAMNAELSARFYDMMVPAEIDRLITGKALGYGLKVNNLLIQSSKDNVVLMPYAHSKNWTDYQNYISGSVSDSSQSDSSQKSSDSKDKASSANLDAMASLNDEYGMYYTSDTSYADAYATKITLDVYGNRDKAQTLLDELIKNKALRVTHFEWSGLTSVPLKYVDGELVSAEVDNAGRLIINFDFYMYDGTDFDELMTREEATADSGAEDSETVEE